MNFKKIADTSFKEKKVLLIFLKVGFTVYIS